MLQRVGEDADDTNVDDQRADNERRDAAALRMLAHPMRIKILGSLRHEGPATSAILARRLGTDTGQTSFHVRLLSKGGFVEELPDKGKGRERWWQAASLSTTWRPPSEYAADEVRFALSDFERAANMVWTQLLDEYLTERSEWSPNWVDSAGSADLWIRATPERLRALNKELYETIRRYDLGDEDAEEASDVVVLLHSFPRRSREGGPKVPIEGWYGFRTREDEEPPAEGGAGAGS